MGNALNLGCGLDYHDDAVNVDIDSSIKTDMVVDLEERPWPWPDENFDEIRAFHVFEHLSDTEATLRECARILKTGGQLITVWPMGINAVADPDHEHIWTWQTPEFYCGKRHWDIDTGLVVKDKSVELHTHLSGWMAVSLRLLWAYQLARFGPGEWCFNLSTMSGEYTVVFKKP